MCRPFGFLLNKKFGKYLSAYETTKVYLAKESCTERVKELIGSGINTIVSLIVVIMAYRTWIRATAQDICTPSSNLVPLFRARA